MIQSPRELDEWYSTDDPWGYEKHPDDIMRRRLLLSELPEREYKSVLDIGCGNGFITKHLPGENVTGIDLSEEAIRIARKHEISRIRYIAGSIFDLPRIFPREKFDLIVITGILYPQYIGRANTLVYILIDQVLAEGGILASVHIDEWLTARFPYFTIATKFYDYRQFLHRMEIYAK